MTGAGPVGLPGLAAMWIGFLAFAVALLVARVRGGREPGRGAPSRRSVLGIAVQTLGFLFASFGVEHVTLDPLGATAIVEAAIVAALMAVAVWLFVWSTRTMGRNWSIVARTRGDHQLVTTGPFEYIRHPIYTALFLMLGALAVATGHVGRLWVAVPLYALGTWLRIGVEERMLRGLFGPAYDGWSARVSRFVPGVF